VGREKKKKGPLLQASGRGKSPLGEKEKFMEKERKGGREGLKRRSPVPKGKKKDPSMYIPARHRTGKGTSPEIR